MKFGSSCNSGWLGFGNSRQFRNHQHRHAIYDAPDMSKNPGSHFRMIRRHVQYEQLRRFCFVKTVLNLGACKHGRITQPLAYSVSYVATHCAVETMANDEEPEEGVAPTGAAPRKRQRTAIAPRAAPTVVEKEV